MRIWTILGTFVVVGSVILSPSKEARAAPACGWSIEGPPSQGLTTTVDEGTWVHVVVRCDQWQTANSGLTPPADLSGVTVTSVNAISGTVPGGWDGAFKPTNIGTTTYNFTVNVGSQTETQGVTITVKPKAPPAPSFNPDDYVKKEEFDPVRDQVNNQEANDGNRKPIGNLEVTAGIAVTPNMPNTTQVGKAPKVCVGGKPVRTKSGVIGLKVDGCGQVGTSGNPTNSAEEPTSQEVDTLMWSALFGAFLDITPRPWLQFDIGARIGPRGESWGQHILRSDAISEGQSQTYGSVEPTLQQTIMFGSNSPVGVRAEEALGIPLVKRQQTAGSFRRTFEVVPTITFSVVGQF